MNPLSRQSRFPEKILTSESLAGDFGWGSSWAQPCIEALTDGLESEEGKAAFAVWKERFLRYSARAAAKLPECLAQAARRCGFRLNATNADVFLFAMQTYYTALIALSADQFGARHAAGSLLESPFDWHAQTKSKWVADAMRRLREAVAAHRRVSVGANGDCDLFKRFYQAFFPRALRHVLGEYYTPDWLADHVLDQVGYPGQADCRLLDPACGSGTFLLLAIRRMRDHARAVGRNAIEPRISGVRRSMVDFPVVGFDVNPLAVITARANYLIAMAEVVSEGRRLETPIYLRDALLEESPCEGEEFDYVVGNPPWIAWDHLSAEDRRATKPLWEKYGLFSLSGSAARYGGSKKDLSALMVYVAADCYLALGGRLGMVITQTVFQTKGAGDGFRRFRLGESGPPLKVLRVDDMVDIRPFDDARNWTGVIFLEKGAATQYPVSYYQWTKRQELWAEGREERRGEGDRKSGPARSGADMPDEAFLGDASLGGSSKVFRGQALLACPIDFAHPTSPWRLSKRGQNYFSGSSAVFQPHLGANSGGANGVFWVEVVREVAGGVLVRNLTTKGKCRVEAVEWTVEPDLVYPLLRWGDIQRYAAAPRAHLLLAQDPATRTGIPEQVMRRSYPRTFAYLERFRDVLTARAAYRRYQSGGPFYSMYNIGPYTVAPIKVVWRRMDRRINAAVVDSVSEEERGLRPAIPQETCVLLACDTLDEAHYVCAVLNSERANQWVAAHSVRGGKGFGSPGCFAYLPLQPYCADDPRHMELASLSRQAHAGCSPVAQSGGGKNSLQEAVAPLQRRMDALVAELWAAVAE